MNVQNSPCEFQTHPNFSFNKLPRCGKIVFSESKQTHVEVRNGTIGGNSACSTKIQNEVRKNSRSLEPWTRWTRGCALDRSQGLTQTETNNHHASDGFKAHLCYVGGSPSTRGKPTQLRGEQTPRREPRAEFTSRTFLLWGDFLEPTTKTYIHTLFRPSSQLILSKANDYAVGFLSAFFFPAAAKVVT